MPRGGPLVGPGVASGSPGHPTRGRAPSGWARETTAASPRAAVVLLSQPPPSVGVERFGGVVAGIDDPVTGGVLVARSSGSGGVVLVRSGCGAGCGGSRSVAPLGVAPGTGFRLRRSGCGCTTVVVVGFSVMLSTVAGSRTTGVGARPTGRRGGGTGLDHPGRPGPGVTRPVGTSWRHGGELQRHRHRLCVADREVRGHLCLVVVRPERFPPA